MTNEDFQQLRIEAETVSLVWSRDVLPLIRAYGRALANNETLSDRVATLEAAIRRHREDMWGEDPPGASYDDTLYAFLPDESETK